jgi:hypothetical protein
MNWSAVGIIFTAGTALFNGILFILIKFNDMRHLELDVKDLKQKDDDNTKAILNKVGELSERISKLEGVVSVSIRKSRKK